MDHETQHLIDELVRKGWRISPDHPSGTVLTRLSRLEQAQAKAKTLVSLVQGSAALEGQAVSQADIDAMVRVTVEELLAGSDKRLWA